MEVVLLVLLTMGEGLGEWAVSTDQYLYMPGHIYPVTCTSADSISGYVQWDDKSAISIKVYPSGVDLLGNDYISIISGYLGWQSIGKLIDVDGQYFVRVQPLTQVGSYLRYEISLYTTLSRVLAEGCFSNAQGLESKSALLFYNPTSYPTIAFYYTASSTEEASVVALDPQNNIIYTWQKDKPYCVSLQSPWLIAVKDNLTSATSLIQFNLTLYYNTNTSYCSVPCPEGYTYNNVTSQCEILPPPVVVPTGAIVGGIVGSVVLIVVVVLTLRCYFRRRNNKKETAGASPPLTQNPDTIQKMHINQNIACPICLEKLCSTMLPCKHSFHEKCITQWFKRNKHCPVCRGSQSKAKIANFYSQQTTQPG